MFVTAAAGAGDRTLMNMAALRAPGTGEEGEAVEGVIIP
jgi:hypothetical protein